MSKSESREHVKEQKTSGVDQARETGSQGQRVGQPKSQSDYNAPSENPMTEDMLRSRGEARKHNEPEPET